MLKRIGLKISLCYSKTTPDFVYTLILIKSFNFNVVGHENKIAIPLGDPAGNSSSYWCISGVLVGDEDDNPPA